MRRPVLCRSLVISAVLAVVCTGSGFADGHGEVIGRPGAEAGPTRVDVVLFMIDLTAVEGADQGFSADLFLLTRWKDERLAESGGPRRFNLDEVWHPKIHILNQRSLARSFPEVVDVEADGTVTYRQRFLGELAAPMDLRDFPLDEHRFEVRLVTLGHSPEEVELVPTSVGSGDQRSSELSISDWSIGEFTTRTESFEVVPGAPPLASLVGEFEGRRRLGFWVGKAFFSVAIIVLMSWVVFWVDPKFVAPRLSVAVTSMLTLIAYRFLLGQALPPLSYLTRMDYFLLGSTALVFACLIAVVATTALVEAGTEARHRRVTVALRCIFPVAFAILFFVTFWLF